MISLEPSKIRLIRTSRSCCSAGTARSRAPRATPPSRSRVPADLDQLVGDQPAHLGGPQLRQAASMRMSVSPRRPGARQLDDRLHREGRGRDERDLPPRPRAAPPGDPLHPLGGPLAGDLQDHLAPAELSAGIDSRPALSVVSAILSPSPSLPSRFSTGTRTVQPGEAVLDPAQAHEGVPPLHRDAGRGALDDERRDAAASTRVLRHPRHDHEQLGDDPVGGPHHAVEQVGRAVVGERRGALHPAGSEPTSGSVSRNAEIAPAAQRGRKRSFCSGVPTSLTGSGTPMDWCAESIARRPGEPTR